jgi:hypothetical protein
VTLPPTGPEHPGLTPPPPVAPPQYDTTDTNWNGTGGTEAQWRARYPVPGATAPTAAPPTAPAVPGQPTTQQQVLNGQTTVGGQTAQGSPTTVAGAFQQALVNRLAPQDITSNNPAIKGSIDANRAAESRGLQRTQGMLAERAAATGQVGAQETGLRQAAGESAGRQGAYEGNALYGLHQQQQNDLTSALGMGGQLLSDQQKQDLQRYGMDLDATLRREGLASQSSLGNRELDIRDSLGRGNLGLGYAGLAQGGQQFGQQLGANLGIEQARLNQSALLALLGGL